jgi:hypothetical protein
MGGNKVLTAEDIKWIDEETKKLVKAIEEK